MYVINDFIFDKCIIHTFKKQSGDRVKVYKLLSKVDNLKTHIKKSTVFNIC